METTKYTPGPWLVENDVITACCGRLTICETHNHANTSEAHTAKEAEANAKLIAAAPELLAACEAGVRLFEELGKILIERGLTDIVDTLAKTHGGDKHGKGSTVHKIRAAIAKATN